MSGENTGPVTRSVSRQKTRSGSKSNKGNRQTENSDLVEQFLQFREVFEDEQSPADFQDREEDLSDDSSSSSSSSDAKKSSEEVPSWAKSLIKAQERASKKNEEQLSELRAEVRALKRKRKNDSDDEYEWKRKGTKNQYVFNRSIEDQLQEIATSNQLLRARMAAEKGLSLIKERNKLLKIADSHGWDTVKNYTTDPLADDEKDDKKLRKAIKDAEKARVKSKADKENKSRRVNRAKTFASAGRESAFSPARLGPPGSNTQRIVLPSVDKRASQLNCYRCGKAGHISRDCLSSVQRSSRESPASK